MQLCHHHHLCHCRWWFLIWVLSLTKSTTNDDREKNQTVKFHISAVCVCDWGKFLNEKNPYGNKQIHQVNHFTWMFALNWTFFNHHHHYFSNEKFFRNFSCFSNQISVIMLLLMLIACLISFKQGDLLWMKLSIFILKSQKKKKFNSTLMLMIGGNSRAILARPFFVFAISQNHIHFRANFLLSYRHSMCLASSRILQTKK